MTTTDKTFSAKSAQGVSRRTLAGMTLSAAAAATIAGASIEKAKAQATQDSSGRLDRILKSGTLRVGQYLQYKPFGFKTPAGEPDGFDVELTKMLASDMGVTPEFIDNTWEGIIPGLIADKFDLVTANMAVTVKRSLAVDFANPISFTATGFIYKPGGRFTSLEQFNDPSVKVSALIQDAVHVTLERFFPKAEVVDFNTADDGILAVLTDKVDASAAEISFLTQFAMEHAGLEVKAVDLPGSSSPAAMGMLPGPDNLHFLNFLNTWVKFYYWTGRFRPLWEKWIPWNPVPKFDKFMAPV